jgi:phosphoribosylglycinamide formyltransferase-1
LGARVLKEATIHMFVNGILNIHPGKIPENRGLDNFKWSLINNMQMANTAHLIDKKIDMGALVKVTETKVFKDDTLYDFYLRHFFSEFSLMVESLTLLHQNDFSPEKQFSDGSYFNAVPSHLDNKLINYFENYKLTYSVI